MGRRRNSGAKEFIRAVAKLPWWVGVGGAILCWVICHAVATHLTANIAATKAHVASTNWAFTAIVLGLAGAGQWILPLLFLAGAGLSLFSRRDADRLVAAATGSDAAQAVAGMGWQEFERLVGRHFESQGYAVKRIGGAGADGGVDLELRKGGEVLLVQCKHWKAFRVGVEVVRELYGVMAAAGAAGGFVVTSGRFTPEAQEFARGRNIKLMDGEKLLVALRQARSSTPDDPWLDSVPQMKAPIPKCPSCGSLMVRRTARKGSEAGKSFWGCSTYPRCRGTLP